MEDEPSISLLMEKVAVAIPFKYEAVGIQLGIPIADLKVLHPRSQCLEDSHRAFSEVFDIWGRRVLRPYKWSTIVDVLKTTHVGEDRLAEMLTFWITGAK